MTIFSYTRLIVYDDKFKLHPDILESYEVKEGREFTLRPDFQVRPILCDNNLSALPAEYQKHIIDRYRAVTMSYGYAGDSVINSLSDIAFMALGFRYQHPHRSDHHHRCFAHRS